MAPPKQDGSIYKYCEMITAIVLAFNELYVPATKTGSDVTLQQMLSGEGSLRVFHHIRRWEVLPKNGPAKIMSFMRAREASGGWRRQLGRAT